MVRSHNLWGGGPDLESFGQRINTVKSTPHEFCTGLAYTRRSELFTLSLRAAVLHRDTVRQGYSITIPPQQHFTGRQGEEGGGGESSDMFLQLLDIMYRFQGTNPFDAVLHVEDLIGAHDTLQELGKSSK